MAPARFNSGRVSAWGIGDRTLPGIQPRFSDTAYSGIPGAQVTGAAGATWTPGVADRGFLQPFAVLGEQITITDAELRVTTQSTGTADARLAIYNVGTNWIPTSLVSDLGTVSIASTGRKQINSLSVPLRPGYYAGLVLLQANASIEAKLAVCTWWSNHPSAANNPARCILQNLVLAYGAAPDPFTYSGGAIEHGGSGFLAPITFRWAL